MKAGKILRLLTSMLSVVLLLSACTSSVSPEDPSDSISESTVSQTDPSTEKKPIPIPTSISSIDRTGAKHNLAEGKTYTVSGNASEEYPDNGKKLTDGSLASGFDKTAWVGYNRVGTLDITVDLGEVENDIADLMVCVLTNMSSGIGLPKYVDLFVSDDGEEYRDMGRAYPSADGTSEAVVFIGKRFAEPISARYVRFHLDRCSGSWTFVGELQVIRYEEFIREPYYGAVELPVVDQPSEWSETEADYQEYLNLIAGKKPMVISHEDVTGELATEYYNSIGILHKLTDGVFSSVASYNDSAYVHFTRFTGRDVLFDLEHTSAVCGAKISFINSGTAGVKLPETLSVSLSENGKEWQTVFKTESVVSEVDSWYRDEIQFDHTYRARFVKITFSVNTHVFCDEMQVYGTKYIPSDALTIVPDKETTQTALGYIDPKDFDDVHNVLLSYHCLPNGNTHTEDGLITVDEYLPYVGYYDADNNLVDTFFDGYLYLPYTRFNYSDFARNLSGWNFYLDDVFAEDRNMSALNQAVGQVADTLSLQDYRCTVYTSVLYPWKTLDDNKTVNTFGDLNGDGLDETFEKLENRKAAVAWMMQQEYDRFVQGNFGNLKFGGFYWFEEQIALGDADEKELILFATEYAHSLGVKIFWIPYYQASGWDRWKDYGFDLACMQPNYMFASKDEPERLDFTADATYRRGMCVEMELSNAESSQDIIRYLKYLQKGAESGYMNSVKMYYQGGVPGAISQAKNSASAQSRRIYDLTYLYAKEKLKTDTPEYTITNTFEVTGRSIRMQRLVMAKEPYTVNLQVSPSHGSIDIATSGLFTYTPDEGYVGVDYFSVIVDFGYAQSEEIIIALDVSPKAEE